MLRLQNKSTKDTLSFCSRIQKNIPAMVCLNKEKFEQVLMLLVNLMIRDLTNLAVIKIAIEMTGQNLKVRIFHNLHDYQPKDLMNPGSQKASE
jgi:hypothetical protein